MTTPSDPVAHRSRRRIVLLVLALVALAAGGWRYRVTRPDYRLARGQEALRAGDFPRAAELADKLDAAGSADRAALLRGETLFTAGEPARALAQFNRVPADGAFRLRAAALSGRCLLQLGEPAEAERVFRFVLSEEPDHADALRGLAVIAYDLGRLAEAGELLTRVAELDPTDARPHRLIGLIHRDLANDEKAVAAYREALRRAPPPEVAGPVRAELGEVLVRRAEYAAALDALEGAADTPEALAARADALRGVGRGAEAVPLVDARLAREPAAVLYRARGQLHDDAKQPADAAGCYERAGALDRGDHRSQYLLSQAYAALGRKDDAARAAARMTEIQKDLDALSALSIEAMNKPRDAGVRLRLAEACDRLNKPQLAAMWRKAAAACPNAP
jgi:tetratricopeptide (TPR) repeat protein